MPNAYEVLASPSEPRPSHLTFDEMLVRVTEDLGDIEPLDEYRRQLDALLTKHGWKKSHFMLGLSARITQLLCTLDRS